MEHWWNDSDKIKSKRSKKIYYQCLYVDNKPHTHTHTHTLSRQQTPDLMREKPATDRYRYGTTATLYLVREINIVCLHT